MESENFEKLRTLYGQLAQILDGVWYMAVEKKLGFETAYDIDEDVWKIYSRKEAKRLRSYFGFETPTFEDIKKVLNYSLWAQSLKFELKKVSDEPLTIHFLAVECKTYDGMKKVGRSEEQIEKICIGVGIAYFEALLGEIVPGTTVKCLYCPTTKDIKKDYVCAWEFVLPIEKK